MQTKRDFQSGRRHFLKSTGAAAAMALVTSRTSFGATPVGANERIGVGIIGCGGRGRHHAQVVTGLKEEGAAVEIVAVCDVYRPRMLALKEKTGAPAGYVSHQELLADTNVDAVVIATPDHIHGPQTIDAIRAGKDVYCEKPFTHWRQHEILKQAVETVQQSQQVFTCGTQGMSDSAWHQMRTLIRDGAIGQPIHAECGYFRVGDWGERGMPVDDPAAQPGPDLNWEAFLGDAPKRDFDVSRFFRWRMYEDYSGGPVTDLFPHSLTPVAYMLDLKIPDAVAGLGGKFRYDEREVPDTFNMLMNYPERLTVAVLGTQGNNYSGTGFRGAGGRVPVIRGWEGTLTVQGSEIVFIPAEGSTRQDQKWAIEHDEHIGRHWDKFLACCRDRSETFSPIDLALHVQTALQMAMMSMRGGTIARYAEGKIIA